MSIPTIVARVALVLALLIPALPAETQIQPPECAKYSCIHPATGLEYCIDCLTWCENRLHGIYQTFGFYCTYCGFNCPLAQVRASDAACEAEIVPVSFSSEADNSPSTASVDRGAVYFQLDLHDPAVYAHIAETAPEIALYLLMNDFRIITSETSIGERIAPAADQRNKSAYSQVLPSQEYALQAWHAFESGMSPTELDRFLRETDTGSTSLPVGAVVRLESFVLPLPAGGMEMTIRSSLTRFNVETGSREVLEVLNRATLVLREKSRTFARVDLPGGESANSGLYEIAAVEISQN